jgi:exopolysaccharide biosynthesis polyprenyl glycosylphosphotransferase
LVKSITYLFQIRFVGIVSVFDMDIYLKFIDSISATRFDDAARVRPVGGPFAPQLKSGAGAMTKLFGHSVRSELLVLYLIETVVCFATIYALLVFGLAKAIPVDGTHAAIGAGVLALSSGLVSSASGLYQPVIWRRFGRFLIGTLVAALLLLLVAHLVLQVLAPAEAGPERWQALAGVLSALVAATMITHLGFAAASRGGLLTRRLAVLRSGAGPEPAGRELREEPFEVAMAGPAEAALQPDFAPEALRAARIWAVIAPEPAMIPVDRRLAWRQAGVRTLSEAEFMEQRLNRVDLALLPQDWLLRAQGLREGRLEIGLRRAFDIAGSLLLLLVTLPLLLLAAIAIKLETRGPVFYRQERVGRAGRVFTLFKFRSMVANAEAAGGPVWASQRDARITRVGRILRLTRIDEIPQVLNVLAGDMALVGPRPERPAFVEQLGQAIPRYHDRASVRPGITGWAQVNYPYGASVEDARMKLAYDLYYVKHRSLFLDLLILVATVRVVLFQEGSR